MTEEEKVDYLDVDDAIPGQNYACLSFVSPDELMEKRDAYNVCKFLQSYCKEQQLEYKELYSKYQDFTYKFTKELQRDFDEQNKFQTSMRGIKVRGIFDTRGAAEARAKKLSTMDSNFHVFIGQVGYWLPWDPCADNIGDEVFQNSQLNDMMEKYQENNVNKDIFYEQQKRDKVKAAREEVLQKKREAELEGVEDKAEPDEEERVEEEPVEEEPVEEEPVEEVKEVHKIDDDMKASLENVDPWLANKLQQKESTAEAEPASEAEPSSEAEPASEGC